MRSHLFTSASEEKVAVINLRSDLACMHSVAIEMAEAGGGGGVTGCGSRQASKEMCVEEL